MEKNIAIEFNNVGKQYRLGRVGTGTLSHDLNRWWQTTVLGKEDPYLKIGEVNDRSKKGTSDYVWALKDISFKVEQGDVVGIIGKNGAGKSTLLKLLSHITAPSTGDIRYRGRIASLLEVGTGFHPEMTARENIYMNGSIMGMTRHEITGKLDEIVDFAGIERYLDTPVKRFSSGMTVRLGFAVAAFLEPEILVVDEVLAVGDAEFQKKAIGKMKEVSSAGGRTVLFVSHNMTAIRNLCTKGILLNNGNTEFIGDISNTIDRYMNLCMPKIQYIPISEARRSQKGNNHMRFISLDVIDSDGKKTIARCGRPFILRLGMEVFGDGCLGFNHSVAIYDMDGRQLITLPTYLTMASYNLTPGKHYAYCRIKKLPLSVGSYRISIWGGENGETCDNVDAVIPLEVAEDAYFQSGKNISPTLYGKIVIVDHEWTIE